MVALGFATLMLLSGAFACLLAGDPRDPCQASEDISGSTLATSITSFSASPTRVFVGEQVNFTATATTTLPGGTIYFTIYFDSVLADNTNNTASPYYQTTSTDSPATITTSYTYDHIGNLSGSSGTYFNVRLVVSDGTETTASTILVYVVENTAPSWLLSLPPSLQYTVDDEEFDGRHLVLNYSVLVVRVKDVDNDELEVTWEFGDGEESTNVTGPSGDGVYVRQSHTWVLDVPPGEGDYDIEYLVNVSVSDGNDHTVTDVMHLFVSVPLNSPPTISLSAPTHSPPMEEVGFVASATDLEGDPLVWTFRFGDGNESVYSTGPTAMNETVWMNVTHSYASIGTYNPRLYVSDALVPNQVFPHNASTSVTITIKNNTLPSVSTINVLPLNPEINLTTGIAAVTLKVQVSDLDGDPLNVTWTFGDESDPAYNTTAGGTSVYRLSQKHDYTTAGSFSVTVVVSDGRGGVVSAHLLLNISSRNRPPNLVEFNFVYQETPLQPNHSFTVVLILDDPELEPIQLYIDFGDDSPRIHANLTDYVDGNVTLTLQHAYNRTGKFTITLWFTDNKVGVFQHTKIETREVTVSYPEEGTTVSWDWWDYTSLGLFCMIPVIGLVWLLIGHRRQKLLERKGISYEEWQLRKDELQKDLEKLKGK